jgi:serine/threonine protein kinase
MVCCLNPDCPNPLNPNDIEQLLLNLLPVLKFVHERGVIHRDIKPQNIIRRSLQPPSDKGTRGDLVLIDYVAENSSFDAAERLLKKINEKCSNLVNFPNMGRKRDELLALLRSFPVDDYLIFYRPKIC